MKRSFLVNFLPLLFSSIISWVIIIIGMQSRSGVGPAGIGDGIVTLIMAFIIFNLSYLLASTCASVTFDIKNKNIENIFPHSVKRFLLTLICMPIFTGIIMAPVVAILQNGRTHVDVGRLDVKYWALAWFIGIFIAGEINQFLTVYLMKNKISVSISANIKSQEKK
ncbi:hypothetical protein [Candidatus Uabimicrobium sp. HlEnr_7]|uniref:hypothetical protein n=1 Tax=Candidatus Uabimicrobium helgolandensis TaxID=3095367 RepID=UPI003558F647